LLKLTSSDQFSYIATMQAPSRPIPERLFPYRLKRDFSSIISTRRAAFLLVFGLTGAFLVRNSVSVPAMSWLHIYHPSDVTTGAEFLSFLRDLKIPIPPILAVAEVLNVWFAGDTAFVTVFLYRTGLVAMFAFAVLLAQDSPRRTIAGLLLSTVFLWSAVLIHPGNPQGYDVFFPAAFLAFLLCLRAAVSTRSHAGSTAFAIGAGCLLALTEQMRPFVILLLPMVLLCTFGYCRQAGRTRLFIMLLIPVVLFSGAWHTHLAVRHGQLIASNHTGYNLARAWEHVPLPALHPEPKVEPPPGRWPNVNTSVHTLNSRILQRSVRRHVLRHPLESFSFMLARLSCIVWPYTEIYDHQPRSPVFFLYRPLVAGVSLWILFAALLLLCCIIRQPKKILCLLGRIDSLLVLFCGATLVILTSGEKGEEARFAISMLPLMTAAVLLWRLPLGCKVGRAFLPDTVRQECLTSFHPASSGRPRGRN